MDYESEPISEPDLCEVVTFLRHIPSPLVLYDPTYKCLGLPESCLSTRCWPFLLAHAKEDTTDAWSRLHRHSFGQLRVRNGSVH